MDYRDSPSGEGVVYRDWPASGEEDGAANDRPMLEVVEEVKLDLASDVFPTAAFLRSVSDRMFGDD